MRNRERQKRAAKKDIKRQKRRQKISAKIEAYKEKLKREQFLFHFQLIVDLNWQLTYVGSNLFWVSD